jgi:L-alanine-DL-glutamate epimerase-like enolase superfamily enzyme
LGYDIPLAIDHLGHMGLDSCFRLGQAFEPFTLAWVEDLLPWQLTEQWKQLTARINTPTCTGEDIYLKENFRPLLDQGAVRVVHPDPATAGGIVETKKIGDLAQEHGVPMALHLAASPIATLASVHIGAATENFLVLEHHAADVAHWDELVTGLAIPLVQDGYISVPEAPGLGFADINEELFRQFLDPSDPAFFEETSTWDKDVSHDRLWS